MFWFFFHLKTHSTTFSVILTSSSLRFFLLMTALSKWCSWISTRSSFHCAFLALLIPETLLPRGWWASMLLFAAETGWLNLVSVTHLLHFTTLSSSAYCFFIDNFFSAFGAVPFLSSTGVCVEKGCEAVQFSSYCVRNFVLVNDQRMLSF